MKKHIKLKRNYMYLCITMLLLSIYVIFFPIIANFLNKISPTLTTCTYKVMTGKNCPLCGGTRYIAGLPQVFKEPSYILNPFGVIILFVIFEIGFRIYCIYKITKKAELKYIIRFDIVIHSIALVSFLIYEITYILTT